MANFLLKRREIGGFEEISLIHTPTNSAFSCIPGLDGMLSGLRLSYADGQISLIQSIDNRSELERAKEMHSGFVFFPFANRLAGAKYEYAGNTYAFSVNEPDRENNLHGILNKEFVCEEVDLDRGTLSILYNHTSTDASYPFSSELRIRYSLQASMLEIEIEISNRDTVEIPVGFGMHPYFSFGASVDDLLMEIPAKAFVQVNEDLIPTGEYVQENPFYLPRKINDSEIDTCFVLLEEGACNIYVPHLDLDFTLRQDKEQLPYLQVFIPSDRQSIALEPVSCIPDAFNNGIGIVHLGVGESYKTSFSIAVGQRKK